MKEPVLILFLFVAACNAPPTYPPRGGYAYPHKNLTSEDENLYLYQLKDSVHGRDYLRLRYDYALYQAFDEGNLSIAPRPQTTIRLSYFEAFGKAVFIVITPQQMIIKKGTTEGMFEVDTLQLSNLEKKHFWMLYWDFPLWDTLYRKERWKRRIDSLTTVYPQLLDSTYYFSLYEKAHPKLKTARPYGVTSKAITHKDFTSLLHRIDTAGYWTLPHTMECESRNTDGWGYLLEINTAQRYKGAFGISCPAKSNLPAIAQDIVRMAGLESEIELDVSWEIFSDTTRATNP